MKKYFCAITLGVSFLSVPMIVGCDEKKSEKTEEHKNADGSKTVDKDKVTTDSKGNTTEVKKSETQDANGNKTVDTSKKTTDANGNVIQSKDEHKDK